MKNDAFAGRVGRKGYILSGLVLLIPFAALLGLFLVSPDYFTALEEHPVFLVIYLYVLVVAVVGISLRVRRFHDLGHSGWILVLWVLVPVIPVLGTVIAVLDIYLLFAKGASLENKYGPPARHSSIWRTMSGT